MIVVMAKDTTFQLDISGAGQEILQQLAMQPVEQAAARIAARAQGMASSQGAPGIIFGVGSRVGQIKVGQRAIATVAAANANNEFETNIAFGALAKARDAGRLN